MTPDVKSVFGRALEFADPLRRGAFLDEACADHPAVRAEVQELLALHENAGGFLRRPAALAPTDHHEPSSDAPGARVGPYKLLEKIGEGGMGEVWVADQLEPIKRRVALKLIKPGMDSRGVLARFEAERQALALMDHPNIARVLDAGTTDDGRPFFVMELVKGTPITEFCDARRLSPRERLELFVQVCQAIQHAHQKGIIHRDIKPSNVLVELYDDRAVPKVIDFGVAKAIGQQLTEKTLYTGFGALVGTPAYMAPEQATFNALDVDTRADVYALGVLLYELLAGSPPVELDRLKKAALDEVLRIVRDEDPPRPSVRLSTSAAKATIAATRQSDPVQLSALIKGELDWIVMKALEKDRTRRYVTANALAKDVERHLAGDAVEACPPTLGYRLRKVFRKNRVAFLAGGAVALALLAATGVSLAFGVLAHRSEGRANNHAALAQVNEEAAVAERDKVARANAELRLIRYAAEMNLLQAAHDAGNTAQVQRVLDATRPTPGQPDVRGSEWHYWDRLYHSHDAEVSIPCPPPRSRVSLDRSCNCAFLPDGRAAAVAVTTAGNGLTLQLRDLTGGERAREIRILPDQGAAVGDVDCYLHPSADGKRLLLQRFFDRHFDQSTPDEPGAHYLAWLIDVGSGVVTRVDDRPAVKLRDRTTSFDGSLEYSIDVRVDVPNRRTELAVRRLSAAEPSHTLKVPGLARAWLSGDRRHLLVCSLPEHTEFGDRISSRKAVLSCWPLGGDKPLWQKEEPSPSGIHPAMAVEGTRFRRLVSENGLWVLRTRDLTTGELVSDMRLAPVAEANDGRTADSTPPPPVWALSSDGQRVACQAPTGVLVCDLGLYPSPLTLTENARHNLRSTDRAPSTLALLADGRVAAAWTPFELRFGNRARDTDPVGDTNRVVIRVWSPPARGAARDLALYPRAVSRDERLFAFAPNRRAAGPDGDRVVQRLCVLEAGGRCIFERDLCTLSEDANDQMAQPHVGFSGDARFVYVLGRSNWGIRVKTPLPLFVWDLQTGQEVARATPTPGGRFFVNPYRSGDSNLLSSDGRLLLLPVIPDNPDEPNRYGADPWPVSGFRVVEFPSGRIVRDFAVAEGWDVRTVGFEGDSVVGTRLVNRYLDAGTVIDVHRWNPLTGDYLGRGERVLTREWWAGRFELPTGRWIVRGDRAVRQEANRVEVWDAARRGPGDRPLFTLQTTSACELSGDGTRLVITGQGDRRSHTIVVCTATGREVLSLPWHLGSRLDSRFCRWSPDGGQFWYGVDADGRPVGCDFRPREVKK